MFPSPLKSPSNFSLSSIPIKISGTDTFDEAIVLLEELGEKYRLGTSSGQQTLIISMDEKERSVIDAFPDADSIHIDDLSSETGQTTFALLGTLLQMEMKGLVQQLPGKYFKRK